MVEADTESASSQRRAVCLRPLLSSATIWLVIPSFSTEQIRKLAELRDQGILTDEEFQSKKKELLSKL